MNVKSSIGLLLIAGSAWAGPKGMVAEAPVATGEGSLNPAIQAGPYESQYGMADQHRYQFNMGPRVTVDNLKAKPFFKETKKQSSPSPSPFQGEGNSKGLGNDSLIKEEEGLTPSGKRSLVDAPMSPPVPVFHTLPPRGAPGMPELGFGRAAKAAPGEIGSTVLNSAAPVSRRAIENLKQPAVFQQKDIPGMTPETLVAAGSADYGLRVIGQPSRLPVALQGQSPVGGAQSLPFPVIVEVRMGPAAQAGPPSLPGFLKEPAPSTRGPQPADAGADGSGVPRTPSAPSGRPLPSGEGVLTPQAAVDKLENDTGMVVDPVYPILMSSPRRQTAFLRGWVSSEKLMALTLNPLVVRVSVVGSAAPSPVERLLDIPVTLHLQLPAQESVSDFIGRTVGGLEKQAGFRWRVARGYQLFRSANGGTVILTGELPASSVDRLLAYPDLLRVEPFTAPTEAPEAKRPAPAKKREPTVLRKATDLVVLTSAFPWMGILVREIFFWIQMAVVR